MKTLIFTYIVLFFSSISFGQKTTSQNFDTVKVIFNAKMAVMYQKKNIHDTNYFRNYLDIAPKFKILESIGFDDKIVFFEIDSKAYPDSLNQIIDSINKTIHYYSYFGNSKYPFIFAYDLRGGRLFRLQGCENNDFESLYWYMKNANLYDKSLFTSKRKFLNAFNVEDLDFNCLYEYFIKENRKFKSCIKSYEEIDNGVVW